MKKHSRTVHTHPGKAQRHVFPAILITRYFGLKLSVSVCILGFLLLLRAFAPSAYSGVCERLSSTVDLRSAFCAVGEGISGKREITEALTDAYQFAFSPEHGSGGADDE